MSTFKKVGIVCLTLLLLFSLSACGGPKTALTVGEFQSAMEEEGYDVIDATDQVDGGFETVLVSFNEEDEYQIEFFVCASESEAVQTFNNVQSSFEAEKANASSNTSASMANYSKYTQTSNGQYYVVSRIDNTLLYVVTTTDNKELVTIDLKSIGY